ncbi:VOC family protein [Actinomyces bovis]|nr:VOC family protein [Actinomyces bovis]
MISTNFWCTGDVDEAAELYLRAFRQAEVVTHVDYPNSGLPDFLERFAGTTMQVELELHGQRIGLTNAGTDVAPSPAISLLLNFDPAVFPDACEYLDQVWAVLSEGATVRMDLGEYPHSPHYGWLQDRFGLSWQLMLTNPDGDPAPFVVPNVLFTEPVLWQAGVALEEWVAAIPGSQVLHRQPWAGPGAPEGAVAFADALLGGTHFSVMDSGPGHSFEFTAGSSFVVHCADQAEIDRVWQALSAVPEAERCGWLVDRFGVSWQVLPANLAELLQREGAYERLLGMRSIEIAELERL